MQPAPTPTPPARVTISTLTQRLGITPRALRYYESEGLIVSERAFRRSARTYDNETVRALETIVLLRQADLSIAEVRGIMALRGNPEAFAPALSAALLQTLKVKRQAIGVIETLLASLGAQHLTDAGLQARSAELQHSLSAP